MSYFGIARDTAELERAFALRREVFCDEQGVSPEVEFDELDGGATHLVGVRDEQDDGLIATCRLLLDELPTCKLGRMAVASSARRSGAGRRLMDTAETEARARGASEILLRSQRQAEPFYASCWFQPEGETFLEENIPHVLMRKAIRRD